VREEDITMFSIYELTFSKYKTKAIELSDTWAKLYSFRFISNFVDIALYFSSYKKELKYF
jgi:hypothetical protein